MRVWATPNVLSEFWILVPFAKAYATQTDGHITIYIFPQHNLHFMLDKAAHPTLNNGDNNCQQWCSARLSRSLSLKKYFRDLFFFFCIIFINFLMAHGQKKLKKKTMAISISLITALIGQQSMDNDLCLSPGPRRYRTRQSARRPHFDNWARNGATNEAIESQSTPSARPANSNENWSQRKQS